MIDCCLHSDFVKFVQLFRNASPYIEGHRGRVFVIVLPGNVRARGRREGDGGGKHGGCARVLVLPGGEVEGKGGDGEGPHGC